MNNRVQHVLAAAVQRLLKPLIRLLLHYGVSYQAFAELAKQTYVDVAEQDFTLPGRKQTRSRIAVLTGLTRKEVARLQNETSPSGEQESLLYNRATRVIGGWMRDGDFHGAKGLPQPLPVEGDRGSFRQLVERYSGDMPVRSTLDELLRTGTVKIDEQQRVTLLSPAYIPETGETEKLSLLGEDPADLIGTIAHNIQGGQNDTFFQLKVCYDNLPADAIPQFRKLSDSQSLELLQQYDRWLSTHDRDTAVHANGEGRFRAGVGIYYFQETLDEPSGE